MVSNDFVLSSATLGTKAYVQAKIPCAVAEPLIVRERCQSLIPPGVPSGLAEEAVLPQVREVWRVGSGYGR